MHITNGTYITLKEMAESEAKPDDELHDVNPGTANDNFSKPASRRFAKRHILVVVGLLGFANVYALRVNLSVALVAMTNSSLSKSNNSSKSKSHECQGSVNDSSSPKKGEDGTFNWDQNTQGIILGSFFYGYIFTQLPGGWIAVKYGAKRVFGYGVLCTSLLTFLTPLAAKFSLSAFIAVRVLEGLGEGVTFPAMHGMWSHWAPPLERTKLVAFTYAGSQIGTIISYPLSGWLCAHGFAGGWPSVFYVFGILGVIWFFVWMFIIYDTPRDHPTISQEEMYYIESAVGQEQDQLIPKKEGFRTPWRSIFSSVPFWAIAVAHFCGNWGFYTLLTSMPTYFKEVLGVHISENGFISAVPFICNFISIITFGLLADRLRRKNQLSTQFVRKLANTMGYLIAAASLIGTSFLRCHQTVLAVSLLSLALVGSGISQSGYSVNHLDISARYAGVLMALTNTVGTLAGIISPYVVGSLTNNKPTRQQWQIVFYISAGFYVFGAIFFLLFASGQEQKWNRPIIKNNDINEDFNNSNQSLLVNG